MSGTQIDGTITKYLDAFNANDLDAVMAFFSDDAVYEPGDGRTHQGKAQIRAAFEPQFNGALGAMRFDELGRRCFSTVAILATALREVDDSLPGRFVRRAAAARGSALPRAGASTDRAGWSGATPTERGRTSVARAPATRQSRARAVR